MIIAETAAGVAGAVVPAAGTANNALVPMDLLELLIIGALMGLLGQGIRAIAGWKGMSDDAKALNLNPQVLYDTARLVKSFLIGTLIGLASVVAYILKNNGVLPSNPDWATLLPMWMAAGYAGTDFLEAFIAQYLPAGTSSGQIKTLALTNDNVTKLLAAKQPSSPPLSPTPTCSLNASWSITVQAFAARGYTVSQKQPDQLLSDMNLADYNSLRELLRQLNDRIDEQHGLSDAFAISWQQKGTTVGTVQNAVEYAPLVPITATS